MAEPTPDRNNALVRAAQIRQLYVQGQPGLMGSLLGAIVLTMSLWGVVSQFRLLLWLGCYVVLLVARFALAEAFKRAKPEGRAAEPWGRWFSLGNFAGGLMWGLAGIFLFAAQSLAHQFLLGVFVTGIACGATAAYSPIRQAYLPTILAELVPLSGRFIYEGTETHIIIGAVVFLFSFILLLTARSIELVNERALRLMFEKNDLIASLTYQAKSLETLSDNLKIENEERKKAEERLRGSLDEKEVLLREIHHRVKNNLQIMSSLLRLQSRYVKDPDYRMIFQETENRILSMALVHEKLYQSDNLANLRLRDYIPGVLEQVMAGSRVSGAKVRLHTDLEDLPMGVGRALPIGFIVTELVSNCMKHAFSGAGAGDIHVSFRRADDEKYVLTVRDNGVGLPEHIGLEHPETLGLRLVRIFVKQVEGTLAISRDNGTEFSIFLSDMEDTQRN